MNRIAMIAMLTLSLSVLAPDAQAEAAVVCQLHGKVKLRSGSCKRREVLVQDLGALTDLAPMRCEKDPGRQLATGRPGPYFEGDDYCAGACTQFDGDEVACQGAFQISPGFATACTYQAGKCLPCRWCAETVGLCNDPCDPNTCADPSRSRFVGNTWVLGCDRLLDEATCNTAWGLGGSGPASCRWDVGLGRCAPCELADESGGKCTNACRPAVVCKDSGRTRVGSCTGEYLEDRCTSAFVDWGWPPGSPYQFSCYWEPADQRCHDCRLLDEISGRCDNACQ